MTDAAVIADSGPAPMDGAPINEDPANFNSPLGSQIPPDAVAKPAEPAKTPSVEDSIDRAIAKSAEKSALLKEAKVETKTEPKPEAKTEQPRENGKFAAKAPPVEAQQPADAPKPVEAAKPSFTASEAPQRFSEDAKKDWATAPESIRRETERAIKELTEGHQKYKAKADRDDSIAEFHEMAEQSGTTVRDALTRFVGLENKLRGDLLGGLDEIISNATQGKASLRDVAAHIMGQSPDQNASQQDAIIRELRQEVSGLKQQVGGVTQTIERQQRNATLTEINKFASENPRFEELSDDIAFFMNPRPVLNERGEVVRIDPPRTKDLSEAYKLAERLNPAPAQANEPPAASNAATPPPVQPDKGLKSINGAPSTGSTPAAKKRAVKSLEESLDAAFGRAG